METLKTERLWRSQPPYLENTGSILNDENEALSLDNLKLLLFRESAQETTQFYIQQWADKEATERRLSYFPHPFPTLKDLTKEILRCDPLQFLA